MRALAAQQIMEDGSRRTFERIVLDHGALVSRILAELGVREAERPDLQQDVWLAVGLGLRARDPSLISPAPATVRGRLIELCRALATQHRCAPHRCLEVCRPTALLDKTPSAIASGEEQRMAEPGA